MINVVTPEMSKWYVFGFVDGFYFEKAFHICKKLWMIIVKSCIYGYIVE